MNANDNANKENAMNETLNEFETQMSADFDTTVERDVAAGRLPASALEPATLTLELAQSEDASGR